MTLRYEIRLISTRGTGCCAPPDHPFVELTKRQFEILQLMMTENEEMICEGFQCWVGTKHTNWTTAKGLLKYCLISGYELDKVGVQYLHINESGQAYLAGEKLIYSVSDGKRGLKKVDRIPIALCKGGVQRHPPGYEQRAG